MSQSNLSHLSINGQENLLTPAEVAALFRVDPKTVTRWAKAGKLTSIRTLGGHRRYKESEVKALLKSISPNTTSNQVGGN
jgi:excisionase family DNA binding protein